MLEIALKIVPGFVAGYVAAFLLTWWKRRREKKRREQRMERLEKLYEGVEYASAEDVLDIFED